MMYPRLLLARQFLRDDGVIFISIDDNEVHHLRKLCDEVFGEENFITQIAWRRTDNQANIGTFAKVKEYILLYCKIFQFVELYKMSLTYRAMKEYRYNDSKGKFRRAILLDKTRGRHEYDVTTPTGKVLTGPWMIKEDEMLRKIEEDEIYWTKGGDEQPYGKIYLSESEGQIPNDFLGIEFGTNQEGSLEVEALFNKRYFDFPKPCSLIKHFVTIGTKPNENHLVLDFFAGSGTTANAVIELNKEDGGNRNFILVQIPELIDEKSEAYKAGYKKISDITIERNKRVIQTFEESEKQRNFDKAFKTGFKVCKLAKSNFPRVEFAPDPTKTEQENLALLDKYIQEKEAAFNTLFNEKDIFDEVLLKNGFMLNYRLEQIDGFTKNQVFRAKDDFKECLICMEKSIAKETLKELERYKEQTNFICLERSLDTTMKWNLKHLLGDKLIAL